MRRTGASARRSRCRRAASPPSRRTGSTASFGQRRCHVERLVPADDPRAPAELPRGVPGLEAAVRREEVRRAVVPGRERQRGHPLAAGGRRARSRCERALPPARGRRQGIREMAASSPVALRRSRRSDQTFGGTATGCLTLPGETGAASVTAPAGDDRRGGRQRVVMGRRVLCADERRARTERDVPDLGIRRRRTRR